MQFDRQLELSHSDMEHLIRRLNNPNQEAARYASEYFDFLENEIHVTEQEGSFEISSSLLNTANIRHALDQYDANSSIRVQRSFVCEYTINFDSMNVSFSPSDKDSFVSLQSTKAESFEYKDDWSANFAA